MDHFSSTFKNKCFVVILNFILFLYNDSSVSRKMIVAIVNYIETLICDTLVPLLLQEITKELKDKVDDLTITKIDLIFRQCKNLFQDINTEFKIKSLLISKGLYIEPEYEYLGSTDKKIYSVDANAKENVYLAFIPLERTLENFLKIPNLFKSILQYMRSLINEKNVISNIIQADWWKRNFEHLTEKIILPFYIYFDDFQTKNVLGSHPEKNKFGGVYGQIGCLPPELSARTDSIHLISMFYTNDRKQFGNHAIFERLINTMNNLREKGIKINIGNKLYEVLFQTTLVIADNMGANSIFGYAESFTANFFCRFCPVCSDKTKYQCEEDPNCIRNPENYASDVEKNDFHETGIKQACIFDKIIGYSSTSSPSADIMHDCIEGSLNYSSRNVIYSLIYKDEAFSMKELNLRIGSFDYNEVEKSNKPPFIDEVYLKSNPLLKMSAAESLCFISNLGLLIGDLVPRGNKYWQLYIVVKKILSIIMVPCVTKSTVSTLKNLIQEHHTIYLKLYGELYLVESMKFKKDVCTENFAVA